MENINYLNIHVYGVELAFGSIGPEKNNIATVVHVLIIENL
jgi:hypothetical protein